MGEKTVYVGFLCYLQFQASTRGLGIYPPQIREDYYIGIFSSSFILLYEAYIKWKELTLPCPLNQHLSLRDEMLMQYFLNFNVHLNKLGILTLQVWDGTCYFHQRQLGVCQKCRILEPTSKLLSHSLPFNKLSI